MMAVSKVKNHDYKRHNQDMEISRGLDGVGYKEAKTAFDDAIAAGRLSDNTNAPNYVVHYMYMGIQQATEKRLFKHRVTRQYIK